MKRYETMSKEKIVGFMAGCGVTNCKDCPAETKSGVLSAKCVAAYLTEEVPEPLMVRRYQNICCKQDLVEALNIVHEKCRRSNCDLCQYDRKGCRRAWFIDYLCELEPEREKEWYLDEKYHKNCKKEA